MRRAARESSSMRMGQRMMAPFMKGIIMGLAGLCGPMAISMKGIGNAVRWMDRGCSGMLLALSLKASLRTTTLLTTICYEIHSSVKKSTLCSKNNENKSSNKRKSRKSWNTGFRPKSAAPLQYKSSSTSTNHLQVTECLWSFQLRQCSTIWTPLKMTWTANTRAQRWV